MASTVRARSQRSIVFADTCAGRGQSRGTGESGVELRFTGPVDVLAHLPP